MKNVINNLKQSFLESYILPVTNVRKNWENKNIQNFFLVNFSVWLPLLLLIFSLKLIASSFDIRSLVCMISIEVILCLLYIPMMIMFFRFFKKQFPWF